MSATNFMGLTMPVFAAFGWAGEETALKFAFEQLEAFISTLHVNLPRSVQSTLHTHGLSHQNQGVYLAANEEVENDVHIAFYARPMSLEIQLVVTSKDVLSKGLAAAEKNLTNAHHLITKLGPVWSLRVQQMLIEEESGVVSHYQDLFKDNITAFVPETAAEVFSKAAYLNGQDKWVTPIYLSRRFPSEQVAAMGKAVIRVMGEQVTELMPLLNFLTGRADRKVTRGGKAKPRKDKKGIKKRTASEETMDPDKGFVYVAELKPLHLRRGFINLTPHHWPFFAINARTETRDVSVYYEGLYDKKSAVWRLQPTDQARLVLGPASRNGLEENFAADDRVELRAVRLDNNEIQVSLVSVE